jgi:hypothetical protein
MKQAIKSAYGFVNQFGFRTCANRKETIHASSDQELIVPLNH